MFDEVNAPWANTKVPTVTFDNEDAELPDWYVVAEFTSIVAVELFQPLTVMTFPLTAVTLPAKDAGSILMELAAVELVELGKMSTKSFTARSLTLSAVEPFVTDVELEMLYVDATPA